jgi:hypothetical protein
MFLDMKPKTLGVSIHAVLVYAAVFDADSFSACERSRAFIASSRRVIVCLFTLTIVQIFNARALRLPDGFSAGFSSIKQQPCVKYVLRRSGHLDFSIIQQNYWLPNEGSS